MLGKDVLQGFLHLLRLVVIEASLKAAHVEVPGGQAAINGMV